MLKQDVVDKLLAVAKNLAEMNNIPFPSLGSALMLDAVDFEEREAFKVDANRKGKKKIEKCTYQLRYEQTEILLRLDIAGPPHDNPDGETVHCPHLHIYREGCGTGWAIPIPPDDFPTPADIVDTLRDFLRYCKIAEIPSIQRPIE